MKRIISLLISLIIIITAFCSCAPEGTEFVGVIQGGYNNYITVSTLDERVDFYDADIIVNVAELDFKPEIGRSIKITIKERGTNEFNTVTIVPHKVELIEYKVNEIDHKKAQELISSGATPVDARSLDEYNMGHIKNAVCLTYKTMEKHYKTALPNKNATLVVYARSEETALLTARHLIAFGYTKVYSMGSVTGYPENLVV